MIIPNRLAAAFLVALVAVGSPLASARLDLDDREVHNGGVVKHPGSGQDGAACVSHDECAPCWYCVNSRDNSAALGTCQQRPAGWCCTHQIFPPIACGICDHRGTCLQNGQVVTIGGGADSAADGDEGSSSRRQLKNHGRSHKCDKPLLRYTPGWGFNKCCRESTVTVTRRYTSTVTATVSVTSPPDVTTVTMPGDMTTITAAPEYTTVTLPTTVTVPGQDFTVTLPTTVTATVTLPGQDVTVTMPTTIGCTTLKRRKLQTDEARGIVLQRQNTKAAGHVTASVTAEEWADQKWAYQFLPACACV